MNAELIMSSLEKISAKFSDVLWGYPLLLLLIGGGILFVLYSRFLPFRYLKHGFQILTGKYDNYNDLGHINHFQALSGALAGTVGMGNISGVAIAIHTGGPGALFWMWISAIVGTATKFFTCSLSIMYRGKDDYGEIQGGPMYVITEGLGLRWKPLAIFFSVAGLFGCLALFQMNQLTQIVMDEVIFSAGLFVSFPYVGRFIFGLIIAIMVAIVIFGGIKRIGLIASRLVPFMVGLYFCAGLWIIFSNFELIPGIFSLIFHDAFTGDAVAGGVFGTVIITGIRRAAFSNEAGIGTEAMAHGAAKTNEPIREGLVAMIGPFIDTIIVCSVTGLVILSTNVWQGMESNGVTLTMKAFSTGLPTIGRTVLLLSVLIFSISTMLSYSYYGCKCSAFLFGSKSKQYYRMFYIITLLIGAMISLDIIINFLDGMFALMAFPTMISTIILAPKVMRRAREYFAKYPNFADLTS